MSGRVKAAATRAPQTVVAATSLLERFAAIDVERSLIEAVRAESVSAANAKADAALVPLIAEAKDIAKQLKPWWAASIDALTGGKRKSIELGGCVIGYRMPPPKVVFAHGKDEDAVAALRAATLDRLIRSKPSPDKPALLTALSVDEGDDGFDTGELLREIGFSTEQKEEFFVDRAGRNLDLAGIPGT